MPDDLLEHVIGPTPYSSVWLWIAIGLTLLLGGWYAAVFVLTSQRRPVRELPVLGAARAELLRRRSARAVRHIGNRYRAGDLTAAGRIKSLVTEEAGEEITIADISFVEQD